MLGQFDMTEISNEQHNSILRITMCNIKAFIFIIQFRIIEKVGVKDDLSL